MLSQYLEFIITVIDFLKIQIEEKKFENDK